MLGRNITLFYFYILLIHVILYKYLYYPFFPYKKLVYMKIATLVSNLRNSCIRFKKVLSSRRKKVDSRKFQFFNFSKVFVSFTLVP